MVVIVRGIRKAIVQSTSPLATTATAKDTDRTAMVSWWRPWILSGWHSGSEVGFILLEDEGPHVRATSSLSLLFRAPEPSRRPFHSFL